ncbi:hypothetical protein [Marinomonas sp. TW1]|uniref:hypothetical protein n=1 Tax=Marinomonas sp. TW1 TaxID=1561203 RepID=UPI0007AF2BCF|nr:hypothetical protein [Marinomonas sp. TW1]KZN12632.1 hypothetical protein OA79_15270 [Marinomonas sp. TW1]
MSFAVFGVSKELAERQAKTRLAKIEKAGEKAAQEMVSKWKFDRQLSKVDIAVKILANIGEIPEEPYQNALNELVSQYMTTLTPKQISPLYGDPKRCNEFSTIARKFGASQIGYKQCVRQEDPKHAGKFKSTWIDVPQRLLN